MRKEAKTSGIGAAVVLALVGLAHGLPWSADMYDQPSLAAGEGPRRPPPQAVPVNGAEPEIRSRTKAGSTLVNPVAPTEQSVAKGRALFGIYCVPCHGAEARGDGTVAEKFTRPPDLRSPDVEKRADGFLYATIRLGGVRMPSYGHVLSPSERWDLVNYVRSLQSNE